MLKNSLLNNTKKYLKKQSPAILSGVAVVGVVASTVLAVKATPKAIILLESSKDQEKEPTKIEIFKTIAPVYIPTAITCLATIACIVGVNVLNKKQQAALTSAYIFLDDSFKKYRQAAINVYGDDADKKIKAEVAKETYVTFSGYSTYDFDADHDSESALFFDYYSRRYFTSKWAAVINAEMHVNRNLQLKGDVSINEFYEFLGLDSIENGDDIGWNMDYIMSSGIIWLDFENQQTKMEDGMECCIVTPLITPLPFSLQEEELSCRSI